ncbi:CPBP family intramembrane metalloprotease [Staphylococcus pseudintermedius]|nr:CPBP family intramembrane metalloprotease [Staphylococcus pseudintermedius]
MLMSLLNDNSFLHFYLYMFSINFIISFVIIPTIFMKLILNTSLVSLFQDVFEFKRLGVLFTITSLISLYLVKLDATVEYAVVALGEEFLFRDLIFILLMRSFNNKESILIGSLLFALIMHLNGNLFINLLTKFPFSIILYYLTNKYRLQDAVIVHWLHNVLVYKFS